MTTMQPVAFKRGATDAAFIPVRHHLSRSWRVIVATASAALIIVATALPLALAASRDRGIGETANEEVQYATFTGVALIDGHSPAGRGEVDVTLEASPAGGGEAPREPPAPPAPVDPPDPCAEALAWVNDAGLVLPPGVGYHCPSTLFSHHGAACWNASPCRDSAFVAINLDLIGDGSPEYLRHVVAHEICHILDFQASGRTSEAGADACAAAHGA